MEPKRLVTKEEYENALAELEKTDREGGLLNVWAGHLSTALHNEKAHGLRTSYIKAFVLDPNLDATRWNDNEVVRADWVFEGRFFTRYLLDPASGKWDEDLYLALPADMFGSSDALVGQMEYVGRKPCTSKRDMISMFKRWKEREQLEKRNAEVDRQKDLTTHSASTDTELHDWLVWASQNGSDFLKVTAEAAFLSDTPSYNLLRPVLFKLREIHPQD